MTTAASDVYFDMYDRAIFASPYRTYQRLRDEAPLYYNPKYDFYLVSRFDDVARVLSERDSFLSGRGPVYNIIASGIEIPNGLFIGEDPPRHTVHRALVSRLFTPRAVNRLEAQVRALFEDAADALVGTKQFDFMKDFAITLPIQVIGMLFGIPESDHARLQQTFHQTMNEDTSDRDKSPLDGILAVAGLFSEYLDWREKNPTDDLLSELLGMEFVDEEGVTRRLRREELLTYMTLIVGAGSDTTGTGIGWAASLLADHPEQRRRLAEDPSLIANAVEEVLRCEPPSYHIGRVAAHDVEIHGRTLPRGSVVVALPGAANRDDRQRENAEAFDVGRTPGQIFTFSFGPHFCLGASLAKLEIKIALEAMLKRFPEWTVDYDRATMIGGIDMRGWDKLPVAV
jgi:cytochrome P450